jgi:hypothetical protein
MNSRPLLTPRLRTGDPQAYQVLSSNWNCCIATGACRRGPLGVTSTHGRHAGWASAKPQQADGIAAVRGVDRSVPGPELSMRSKKPHTRPTFIRSPRRKEGGRDRKPSSLAAFKLMRSSDSFNAITLSTTTLPQEGDRRKTRKSSHPMVAGIKIGAIVPTLYGAKFPSSASRR